MLMAFLLLGVIAVAPEIILIMGGRAYYEAAWAVPPVAMSILLLFYSQLFINVEFYFEEKTMLVFGSILAAVLNFVLNMLLIPVWGFVAAAYTTLISYIAFAVSNYYTMRYVCKKHGFSQENHVFSFLPLIFTLRHCMLYTRKQVCLGTIFYTGPSSGLLYIVLPLSITPAFFFCARSDLAVPERALRSSPLGSSTQVHSPRGLLGKTRPAVRYRS
jgi:O-antigen/teichoic acid export membrane protein